MHDPYDKVVEQQKTEARYCQKTGKPRSAGSAFLWPPSRFFENMRAAYQMDAKGMADCSSPGRGDQQQISPTLPHPEPPVFNQQPPIDNEDYSS